jgi:flagellar assembly protein FliH
MARVIRGGARVVRVGAARGELERAWAERLVDLARERARLRDAGAEQVATLALEVAMHVIGEQVAVDPALLARIVGRALAKARAESSVRVTLHPDDRAALEHHLGERGLPPEVVLEDDASQARGGCVVRGPLVTVDARVETALATIAHAMGIDRPT